MRIALIVSCYNRPDLLSLCLCSIHEQERQPDQIIMCDDGSDYRPLLTYPGAIFLEQKHNGFGKQLLLNRAIVETDCDYLVFTDQDCILPPDWLAVHERIAKRGQYVCGMYTSLTQNESTLISRETIESRSIWNTIKRKYEGEPYVWAGCGSTCWRDDALEINGFDERFGWSGPDYNFGLRLTKLGRSWIHSSPYTRNLHLWHDRPYALDMEDFRSGNRKLANEYARQWAKEAAVTAWGIRKDQPVVGDPATQI